MKEVTAKYLAGLCDADASLYFHFTNSKCYLEFSLCASDAIDKNGKIMYGLVEELGMGRIQERLGMSNVHYNFNVSKLNELNKLIPALTKHMVIKAKHWNWLLKVRNRLKGKTLDITYIEALKQASAESRKEAGPLKHKSHPTWAWVAGYLDGDGNYKFRNAKNQKGVKYKDISVGAVAHINDRVSIDLLHKNFKGSIYEKNNGLVIWYRNLGPRDSSFVLRFLPKIIKHSRLKKWKIEQIISYHKQRLNPDNPEG